MTGPAPWELAEQLHRAVALELQRRLKAEPSTADLTTARLFLADQRVALTANDEADRKRFTAIRRLYLQRLQDALEQQSPTAAVLMEVLKFMTAAGIVQGIGTRLDAHRTLQTLTALDMPFQ